MKVPPALPKAAEPTLLEFPATDEMTRVSPSWSESLARSPEVASTLRLLFSEVVPVSETATGGLFAVSLSKIELDF